MLSVRPGPQLRSGDEPRGKSAREVLINNLWFASETVQRYEEKCAILHRFLSPKKCRRVAVMVLLLALLNKLRNLHRQKREEPIWIRSGLRPPD